jgi:hypothetical protein
MSAAPMTAGNGATARSCFSLLTFAGVVFAAAALPLVMWRRAVLSVTGADSGSVSLVWLAVPAAAAVAAAYVTGAAINRRFAQALAAQRNRT